jgi:KipI family sensor histidine kinase inhibitor
MLKPQPPQIRSASDSSIIVLFGEEVQMSAHHRVLQLFYRLSKLEITGIRNIHPAYASVLVDFEPLKIPKDDLISVLQQLLQPAEEAATPAVRTVQIPVCYDVQLGPDLEGVAAHCELSIEEVIRIHSSADYIVSFLGFTPGFGYLLGLPEQLVVPRLANPRRLVYAGSVGIAGVQTGVYSVDSPGGWRIIGRTPLNMFDPDAESPTLLQQGDRVRFVPISIRDFEQNR